MKNLLIRFNSYILSKDSLKTIKGGYGESGGGRVPCRVRASCKNGSSVTCYSSLGLCSGVDQTTCCNGGVACDGYLYTACPKVYA